jgi:CBS domain-containing protein
MTYTPPVSQDLAMTGIQKFMNRKPIAVTHSATISTAISAMLTHGVSGLAVVDDSASLLGYYSEMDALLQAASGDVSAAIKFKKPALSIKMQTVFKDALILMVSKKLKSIPVVDDRNKLVGSLSRRDLMSALFEDSKKGPKK